MVGQAGASAGREAESCRLSWDPSRRGFTLTWPGRIRLPFCLARASIREPVRGSTDPLAGLPPEASLADGPWPVPGTRVSLADPAPDRGPCLAWEVSRSAHRVLIDLSLSNRTDRPLHWIELVPLAGRIEFLDGGPGAWRFFKMSSNTTTPSGSVSLAGSERGFGMRRFPEALLPGPVRRMLFLPEERVAFGRRRFSSQWFALLSRRDPDACLLVGFLGTGRHFSSIRLDARHGCLQAVAHGEGCAVPPGGEVAAHRLVMLLGDDPHACLETYLDLLVEGCGARFRSCSLWGSWYTGFYDRFTWDDLSENLEQAASLPGRIEYFQVDDGYQKGLGEWLDARPNLPEGLAGFVRSVRRRGMKPGVWVAPFAVGRDTAIYRDHRDWLVRSPAGRPVLAGVMPGRLRLRPYHGLDLTLPEVQDWLAALFGELVDMGFELFKLDYLAAGALPGRRHDPTATSAYAYRRGLEVIRDAAGDRPLMGALAPQLCGVGLLDIQRVSTDSSFGGNHWFRGAQRFLGDGVTPCIRNNLRNNLSRASFADRIWTSDCDAILYGGLSEPESRTHMAANLLLGGVFQAGYDLRKGGYPWADIDRLLAYRPWRRVVPDLFEQEEPCEALVAARCGDGREVLLYLALNVTGTTIEKPLRDPARHFPGRRVVWEEAKEFWNEAPVRLRPGDAIRVEPHGACLLEIPLAER